MRHPGPIIGQDAVIGRQVWVGEAPSESRRTSFELHCRHIFLNVRAIRRSASAVIAHSEKKCRSRPRHNSSIYTATRAHFHPWRHETYCHPADVSLQLGP